MEVTKGNWVYLKAYGRTGQSFKRSSSALLQKLVIYLFQGKLIKTYWKLLSWSRVCYLMHFELGGLYMFLQIRSTSLFAPHPPYPLSRTHFSSAWLCPLLDCPYSEQSYSFVFPFSSSPLLSCLSCRALFNPIGFPEENVVGTLWLSSQSLVLPPLMSLCWPEPFCCFIWLSGWDSLT